ncbi:MAG: porin [Burkholderiaceae bacterium]|jgi:predicted porin|nr:porin [Burkholderiaceae bacterium]
MKKTLIALAVLGAAAGVAHAQSNVTVYGIIDTGYVKMTGKDAYMDENINSRVGFRGSEDLGNGLKAIFQLEKRFNVGDGTMKGVEWDGNANIGLQSNTWGKIRFGRMNELTTETLRKFDPFYQYGVGGMLQSSLRSARISNTARYDSPKWAGFSFGLSYSLGQGTGRDDANWAGDGKHNHGSSYIKGTTEGVKRRDLSNDGYALNLSYYNGPWMATANWSRLADSGDSYNWNAGVSYKFGGARVMLAYEQTRDKLGYSGFDMNGGDSANIGRGESKWSGEPGMGSSKQQSVLLGLEWDIGPGQFDISAQYLKMDDYGAKSRRGPYNFDDEDKAWKASVGYTYNLSKRTSVYGMAAYLDMDGDVKKNTGLAGVYGRESVTAFQLGMTHKF